MQKFQNRSFMIDGIRSAVRTRIDYVYTYPNETHDLWEFIYVIDGVMGAAENDNIYRLTKGQIIFHRPMEFHRIWSETKEGYEIILISFHTDTDYLHQLGDGVFNLSLGLQEELIEIFNSMNSYVIKSKSKLSLSAHDMINAELSVRRLEVFLLKLMSLTSKSKDAGESSEPTAENYRRIMNVLYNNIHKNLSVKDIAKLSNLSVSNLNKTFKRYTGKGVMNHFNRMKIISAMKMLDEDMPISEISDSLDFSSQAYFLTVFKRYTDMLPSAYKKSKIKKIK